MNWAVSSAGRIPTTVVSPPYGKLVITLCTTQSVALLTTCFRLVHRTRIRKLGWDDLWAFVALSSDTVLFVSVLMIPSNPQPNQLPFLRTISWLILVSYTLALWAARLTISVTITERLLPHGRMRLLSKVASSVFCLSGLGLVVHKLYFCTTTQGTIMVNCNLPKYTGMLELITDGVADLWLILAPVYMIFGMKLSFSHTRLILGIFICGILTSAASIAHGVGLLLRNQFLIALTGHIQVAVAIIVSNLLVLVTVAYSGIQRFRQHRRDIQSARRPAPSRVHGNATGESGTSSPINLTQLSTNMGVASWEHQSVSFLSTAPFSSFSYSTSTSRSMQSVPMSLGKVVEESVTVNELSSEV